MPASYVNKPSYQCFSYRAQLPDLRLVEDVFAGTRRLREKGPDYLPQEPGESVKAYNIRRCKAVCFPAFKSTVWGLTGMIFRRDATQSSDIPDIIKKDLLNVDLNGTHLDVFARKVFSDALRDGHTYIYVDHQIGNPDEIVSVYDYEKRGNRPYWIQYTKKEVINWKTSQRNGQTVLEQVTIEQKKTVPEGKFGEKAVTEWLVLYPGRWERYDQNPNHVHNPIPYASGRTSLDFIPLVAVYTNRTGYFESEPPLVEIANLNIRHFQIYSDYAHILHVANVPILWFIGRLNKQRSQEVGPNAAIDLDDGGSMGFAEHGGSAISGARTEIQDLEQRMAMLGLQLTAPKSSTTVTTATEKVINQNAQSSMLSGMARDFKDCLEVCLDIHAKYRNLESGGSLNIIKDFNKLTLDPQVFQLLIQMVKEYNLDVETLWVLMEQADMLPDDFDKATSQSRIKIARDAEEERQKNRMAHKALGRSGYDPTTGKGSPPAIYHPPNGPGQHGLPAPA